MSHATKNTVFYHIPKTGGMWVLKALERGGVALTPLRCKKCAALNPLQDRKVCCGHGTYQTIQEPNDGKKRLRFGFVRNPLSMYQSYWAYKMEVGWDTRNAFDRAFARERFPDFVRAVTVQKPGWVSTWFESYVGPQDAPALGFMGRQENLMEDLLTALKMAGEEANEEAIRATEAVNAASFLPRWQEECRYTPELADRVWTSEQRAMERFGYW
jgi:hypothetical protein